jgi:anti-anti-sigma factor
LKEGSPPGFRPLYGAGAASSDFRIVCSAISDRKFACTSSNHPAFSRTAPTACARSPTGEVAGAIAVEGWLDPSSVPALERALADAFEQGRCRLVLDLHQLRSVDPIALEVFWSGLRGTIRRGGSMSMVGLRPSLHTAVEPLIAHGMRLHETVREALTAPREPTSLRP